MFIISFGKQSQPQPKQFRLQQVLLPLPECRRCSFYLFAENNYQAHHYSHHGSHGNTDKIALCTYHLFSFNLSAKKRKKKLKRIVKKEAITLETTDSRETKPWPKIPASIRPLATSLQNPDKTSACPLESEILIWYNSITSVTTLGPVVQW